MALDGTPITIQGSVTRDDPHKFLTSKGKKAIGFTVAVFPDSDAEKPDYYDVATAGEKLAPLVAEEILGGTKNVVVVGTLIEKPGNNGKVFRNVWANRIGIVQWLGSQQTQKAEEQTSEEAW